MTDNKIDLNKKITLKQLIKFAKKYDGDGAHAYEESEFEGAEVVSYILGEMTGGNNQDLKYKFFGYTKY